MVEEEVVEEELEVVVPVDVNVAVLVAVVDISDNVDGGNTTIIIINFIIIKCIILI